MSWVSSGGTRAKKVLIDPAGKEYFFKCSEKKPPKNGHPEKHYKYEFWNEIIAYQLGRQLGLNMLRYDLAIYKNEIGCISPNMIDLSSEQLIEVGRLMTAINPKFTPETNEARKQYTFQLLIDTISKFDLLKYLGHFLQIILFDSIISNRDRHQENWAFISNTCMVKHISKSLKIENENDVSELLIKIIGKMVNPAEKSQNLSILKSALNINQFAPIYDSGSSLGRELLDDRIDLLLEDEKKINEYIDKGKSEVHWNNVKISHFDLIDNLLKSPLKDFLIDSSQFLKNWDSIGLDAIFDSISKSIPNEWRHYDFPSNRRRFIIKLLTLRFERIKPILSV